MTYLVADRVWETSSTTGTGAFSLEGAKLGYRAFSAAFSSGNSVHYCIALRGASEWEVGLGALTSGAPWTLTRTTVLASSNAGAAVNFSDGTKDVFNDVPASFIAGLQASIDSNAAALAAKAPLASPSFTGNVTGAGTLRWGHGYNVSNTDLDVLTTPGFYVGSALGHSPDGGGDWWSILVQTLNTSYVSQTAWGINLPVVYTRLKINGTWGAWSEVLSAGHPTALNVGYWANSYDAGNKSSGTFTPDPSAGNFQYFTNLGAFTLAPTAAHCSIVLDQVNGASAGAITRTGFTKVTGDALTTTNGHKFRHFITVGAAGSHCHTQALQ